MVRRRSDRTFTRDSSSTAFSSRSSSSDRACSWVDVDVVVVNVGARSRFCGCTVLWL